LDFKVSDNIRDNPNICEFILNYFNNPQETKVFHFVNFHMPLIPSEDWNIFCNLVNAFRFSKGVFLEIVNNLSLSYAEVDYDSCLDRVMMLDTKKFIGVDYHHIISNNEANFISLKNDSGVVGKTIPYDPKINYGNE